MENKNLTKKNSEYPRSKSIAEINLILKNRAIELAKIIKPSTKNLAAEIIEFSLGNETYGIESKYVMRVTEAKEVTALPNTPAFIEGIMNVHGNLNSVINLQVLFELPTSTRTKASKILIVNYKNMYLGLLVDAITKISAIDLSLLQTTLPTLKGLNAEFLLGITAEQKIILNIPNLLTSQSLIINEYV